MSQDASSAIDDLDRWIRGEFTELNTELEEIYFTEKALILHDRAEVTELRRALVRAGGSLISRVAEHRELPRDPGARYELLGMVGFYLGACRRHEVEPDQSQVTPLAMALSASLGVAPGSPRPTSTSTTGPSQARSAASPRSTANASS